MVFKNLVKLKCSTTVVGRIWNYGGSSKMAGVLQKERNLDSKIVKHGARKFRSSIEIGRNLC
jgi:hypothetical protein